MGACRGQRGKDAPVTVAGACTPGEQAEISHAGCPSVSSDPVLARRLGRDFDRARVAATVRRAVQARNTADRASPHGLTVGG